MVKIKRTKEVYVAQMSVKAYLINLQIASNVNDCPFCHRLSVKTNRSKANVSHEKQTAKAISKIICEKWLFV